MQAKIKTLREPAKLRVLAAYFAIIGVVGFVNGGVICLTTVTNMDKLPMGLATALLLLLYGVLSSLFCWVLAGPLESKNRGIHSKLLPT